MAIGIAIVIPSVIQVGNWTGFGEGGQTTKIET